MFENLLLFFNFLLFIKFKLNNLVDYMFYLLMTEHFNVGFYLEFSRNLIEETPSNTKSYYFKVGCYLFIDPYGNSIEENPLNLTQPCQFLPK